MSNISHINLEDLKNKIGSHKFEIIDISTKWCNPCKMMSNAMEKILKSKNFKDVDIKVYVIDGDFCSSIVENIELAKKIKNIFKDVSFPMTKEDFLSILKKLINDDYSEEDWIYIIDSTCDGTIFENKNEKIYLKDFLKWKNIFNPYVEFQVSGYPTIILFKDGKPILDPIDPNDYESRGFEYYDSKIHGNLKDVSIVEVENENGKKVKIVQVNKKLNARIVGFRGKKTLTNLLKKYVDL